MAFVHLHVHTEYSPLDGMIRSKVLPATVKNMGQTAVASTDHGNLAAAWNLQQHADAAGVKYIAGYEGYLAVGSRFEKNGLWVPADDTSTDEDMERSDDKVDAQAKDGLKSKPYMHLTVLARNEIGWKNLVQLNNKAQESIWFKPRIDFDLLAEHGEGLIVLTGCLGGPILGPTTRAAFWRDAAEAIPEEYAIGAADRWIERLRDAAANDPHGVTQARSILDERAAQRVAEAASAGETFDPIEWTHAEISDLATDLVEARNSELRSYEETSGLLALRARLHQERHLELLALAEGETAAARANLQQIIDAVGADNTYVEIMDHGIPSESAALPEVVALAREFGVGIVATNDAHHTHEADAEAHSGWLLVQSKSTIENPKYQFHGHGYWLRSEEEMRALRPEPWWQEACDTTQVIADRCADRVLPAPRNLLPRYPTPDGFATNRDFLFHLLRDGASRLFGGIDAALRERVMTEMDVIDSAGMADYFLVVWDLITWCRSTAPSRPGGPEKKPILVGPGRGSGGGSMVAHLLGITQINPFRYGLLFERFYERGRSEPPDFDVDFPQGRRQEVIQYLRDRWGAENVASIGTIGMARSKEAIDSAARILGQQPTGKAMKKLVPTVQAKPMAMGGLLNADEPATAEYRRLFDNDDVVRRVHGIASTFEDVVSGFGIHASGVIVSAEPLGDLIPLRKKDGSWVLQWTGPEAEQFGLLKVDVLGLRNLDIIDRARDYIRDTTGEDVDPMTLPDPDEPSPGQDASRVANAWKLIGDGHTAGIFQMESAKMTELAMQVGPRRLNEESAIVALYRPGPMGMGAHTSYANRKRGLEPADYSVFTRDPREEQELRKVLDETYGLIVYQEQVMMLGTVMAGFDATGRSKLRKAVSKKKKSDLEAMQSNFFELATRELRDDTGKVTSIAFSKVTVQAIWDTILVFAEYAFNKAHSATYGYLAYMTAFYKANWPASYAAANLAVTDDKDKRLQVLGTLRDEQITVLPPDINALSSRTAPDGPASIRFGISEVKGLGEDIGDLIASERRTGGEFTSLRDMFTRVQKPDGSGTAVSAAHLKALISAGAADAFGPRLGHMSIVGAIPAKEIPVPAMEWGVLERSARQREALLTPLGEHPLVALREQVAQVRIPSITGRRELDAKPVPVGAVPSADGAIVTVLGVLASWAERPYSRGILANLSLEGSNATISGTIWDRTLVEIKQAGETPTPGDIVLVKARVRYNVIAADPDDPTSEETSVKELSVNSIRAVSVIDPAFGELPATTLPRLDLTALPVGDGEVPVLTEPDEGQMDLRVLEPSSAPSDDLSVELDLSDVTETAGPGVEDDGGPLVFDLSFDTPRPPSVVEPSATAPGTRSPAHPAVATNADVAPTMVLDSPTAAASAALPDTRDMEIAGMLIDADIAQGGAGLITHAPAPQAHVADLTVTPRKQTHETQLVAGPIDGLPTFEGWLIGMALLSAEPEFPGVGSDLRLADQIEQAMDPVKYTQDVIHVLVSAQGTPKFVVSIGA